MVLQPICNFPADAKTLKQKPLVENFGHLRTEKAISSYRILHTFLLSIDVFLERELQLHLEVWQAMRRLQLDTPKCLEREMKDCT